MSSVKDMFFDKILPFLVALCTSAFLLTTVIAFHIHKRDADRLKKQANTVISFSTDSEAIAIASDQTPEKPYKLVVLVCGEVFIPDPGWKPYLIGPTSESNGKQSFPILLEYVGE
jgi:hypothetical protein